MKKGQIRILLLITFQLLQFSVFSQSASFLSSKQNIQNSGKPPFLDEVYLKWADSVLQTLTLEEKIAQSFMVAVTPLNGNKDKEKITEYITKNFVGGLIFFKGSPKIQAELTNYYQSISKIPLLVSIDAEWGLAMRLDSTIRYPDQMMLAALDDDQLIYEMGKDIASQCKRLGIHINFAPVIDVNNNPVNPVINLRSFGENKNKVAQKGYAYMAGMQDNGIMAVGKHFPGHGDTDKDSHYELPVLVHSYKRLDSIELYPFKELIKKGVGGIMTAHIHIPSIDSEKNMPASLSSKAVKSLLIDTLGFQGLIFSDALNMKGASIFGDQGKVEEQAYLAGNDILLCPNDVEKAINRIKRDLKQEKISLSTIDARCRKILAVKKWTGADRITKIDTTKLFDDLNKPSYNFLKNQIIEKSITLVTNRDSFLPLKNLEKYNLAVVSIGNGANQTFHEYISYYTNADYYSINKNADRFYYNSYYDSLSSYNLIILGIHQPDRKVENNFGFITQTVEFVNKLCQNKKVILTLFTNPYSLSALTQIDSIQAIVVAYNDLPDIQKFSAEIIFGGIPASGRLPVSVAPYFKEGWGIQTSQKIRLKYGMPEDLEINTERLNKVDSIINLAIRNNAFPGCQVLCAKDGIVFYHKSFGNFTYQNGIPVKNNCLYDIASVTKVAATVPALMKLYDEHKISPDSKLSDFLPELSRTNKGNLIFRDILIHQARLKAWIPFYTMLYEPLFPNDRLFSKDFSPAYPYNIIDGMNLNKNFGFKRNLVSTTPDTLYSIKLTSSMFASKYCRDSIFLQIDKSELLPESTFRYSDLGYFYFYRIIERISGTTFDNYVYNEIYKPAGISRLCFLPLNRYSINDIAPTENDQFFRRQLIQGTVHDAGAALMGGICGHAGLFSNSASLATLMQIYLQRGNYGGREFFKPETVDLFTTAPVTSKNGKRALGFEKKGMNANGSGYLSRLVSQESYGHTGFTGTIVWADPVYNLIFIFLSNRVYPDVTNSKINDLKVRAMVQEEFYKAVIER